MTRPAPQEPTAEMIAAGAAQIARFNETPEECAMSARAAWRAMWELLPEQESNDEPR